MSDASAVRRLPTGLVLPTGLTTPCLTVDVDRLERNVAATAAAAAAAGLALRPHAKTHKCAEIARLQLASGAVGLTVATIGEAEAFAVAGVDDLFIAYPLWLDAGKAERVRRLLETVTLSVGVDSAVGARRLAEATEGAARPVRVLVEIDSGHHRTGVAPQQAGVVAAEAVAAGLDVVGVFTFPGHGYGPDARRRAAAEQEAALETAAHALRARGVEPQVVSGGSTPTFGHTRGGVLTEVRPGVSVFYDAAQVEMGSCTEDDVALVAAATVVSVPADDRFVIDAGSKVLGADLAPWMSGQGLLPGFPGARVTSLSEHHAVVTLPPDAPGPRPGDVVAAVPVHVCSAVNLADELVAVRGGRIIDVWSVMARGANA